MDSYVSLSGKEQKPQIKLNLSIAKPNKIYMQCWEMTLCMFYTVMSCCDIVKSQPPWSWASYTVPEERDNKPLLSTRVQKTLEKLGLSQSQLDSNVVVFLSSSNFIHPTRSHHSAFLHLVFFCLSYTSTCNSTQLCLHRHAEFP